MPSKLVQPHVPQIRVWGKAPSRWTAFFFGKHSNFNAIFSFLEPLERTKIAKVETYLQELNCPTQSASSYSQEKSKTCLKGLYFGLNFSDDLAKGGTPLYP